MKKKLFTILALIIMISSHFVIFSSFNRPSMAVLGTFIGTLILWVTVDITWPSLIAILSLAFIPEVGMNTALSSSFGNSTFAFLLFTFICTYAISQTSFIRKTALFFITSKFAQKSIWHMSTLFLLSVLLMGLFISPTVLFFIFLPILNEIYDILGLKKGDKFASMLIMGMAIFSNLSAGMTPIAHVFPVLAMGVYESVTGNVINYGQYMLFGIPVGLILFVLTLLVFRFVLNPSLPNYKGLSEEDFKDEPSKMNSFPENMILFIFFGVVLLWVLPSLISKILPELSTYISSFGSAMPPLLGVVVMAIISIEGKPLVNISEAITKGVSWPALIMSSGTLLFGTVMTDKGIGLIDQLITLIQPITTSLIPSLLILFFIVVASLSSNITSHMVTAQVFTSMAVPVALSSNGQISAAAIAAVIGLCASLGTAAPSSMPFVAVSASSGWTDTEKMLKYGVLFMILTIIVSYLIGYPLAQMILG